MVPLSTTKGTKQLGSLVNYLFLFGPLNGAEGTTAVWSPQQRFTHFCHSTNNKIASQNRKYALLSLVELVEIYTFLGGPNRPKICGRGTNAKFKDWGWACLEQVSTSGIILRLRLWTDTGLNIKSQKWMLNAINQLITANHTNAEVHNDQFTNLLRENISLSCVIISCIYQFST